MAFARCFHGTQDFSGAEKTHLINSFSPELYEIRVLALRAFASKKKTYPEGREHFCKPELTGKNGVLGIHVGRCLVWLGQIEHFVGTKS